MILTDKAWVGDFLFFFLFPGGEEKCCMRNRGIEKMTCVLNKRVLIDRFGFHLMFFISSWS
jgi:hypothetical protein